MPPAASSRSKALGRGISRADGQAPSDTAYYFGFGLAAGPGAFPQSRICAMLMDW